MPAFVPPLATALAVLAAAALSEALAFGRGAVLLLWLPPSVALVAILAGGRRNAVAAAAGIAAWAAPQGAAVAAWAVCACAAAPLAAAAAFDAWGRVRPTPSQFVTTARLLTVCAGVLAPLAAVFDRQSGLLAPALGAAGLDYFGVFAIEATSAALAVRALMTLVPDRAGGYCPIEVARTGRVGLSRGEWVGWTAMGAAYGAGALATALDRPGSAKLLFVLGFSVAIVCSLVGNRRNTSTMLMVATVATFALWGRVLPVADASALPPGLALYVLLTGIGAVLAHLLNATSAERIEHAERLERLAMTDAESGLPNLRAFRARLDACRSAPQPDGGQLVSIRVPDVGRWAELAGSAAASAFEAGAGRALQAAFADEGGRTFVAHVATGRYALLVPGRTEDATILARVRGAIDLQRLESGGERGVMRSIVGVVDVPCDPSHDPESLLAAMSIAEQQASRVPERYQRVALTATLVDDHRADLRAMRAVREAVQEGRVRLLGQPIVRADGGRDRLHFEVLARLLDEEGREIPPAAFLPVLSRQGMLEAFDRLVFSRALEHLGRDDALRAITATVAINLTGPTLADPRFPAFAAARIAATGIDASVIKLEITESDPITSLDVAIRNTDALLAQGLRVALDDFGTGLATFDYLRRFLPDWVKIDGSFVRGVEDGPLARQIVDSIVRVARAAGAVTVAECVETPALAERMRELGVDYLQGWGIARPMPLEALVAFARQGAPADPHAGAVPSVASGPSTVPRAARAAA